MTQETKTTAVAKQGTKKIDVLKGILNTPSVQDQFKNALNKNSGTFVASVIDLYNNDDNLQACEPKQVVMEALKAAVLHLPINKALGYAYIVAYNNSKKESYQDSKTGKELTQWVKVPTATFQMGYKGYIQLAMRTGQYRTLNADVVYEGELRKVNKLTGEIAFDGEKLSDKVVGYFCYFELLNGFSKTLYMDVKQIATHAKRYSKSIKRDTTVDTLIGLANLPVVPDSTTVGWMGNFHGMALKTVIRLLLSKWGYLSIEMQEAFSHDIEGDERNDIEDAEATEIKDFSVSDVSFKDINDPAADPDPAATEVDPGY